MANSRASSDSDRSRIGRLWLAHGKIWLLCVETNIGHRNGYLRLPEDHPWYQEAVELDPKPIVDYEATIAGANAGMDEIGYTGPRFLPWPKDLADRLNSYENRMRSALEEWFDQRVDIHGGWTFAELNPKWDNWHLDGDGIPEGMWFGFDTGHYMDHPDHALLQELNPAYYETHMESDANYPAIADGHAWTLDDIVAELTRAAADVEAARIALAGEATP